MALPIFPNIEQIMDILMGEFPANVYAEDRADNIDPKLRSYSSSEIRAHASMIAALYANMQAVWQDKFISTVNADSIAQWEMILFGTAQDSTQPLEVRRANLLTKFQSTGGISYTYINNIIHGILDPLSIPFQIIYYTGFNGGAWILDESPLDVSDYLAGMDPLEGAIQNKYVLDCNFLLNLPADTSIGSPLMTNFLDTSLIQVGAGVSGPGIPNGTTVVSITSGTSITVSQNATSTNTNGSPYEIQNYIAAGLTLDQLQSIQTTAYTYEVRILGNADAATLTLLDQTLTQLEKAGSTHIITNNFPNPPPFDPVAIDMGFPAGDTLIDVIDCGIGPMPAVTYDVWDFSL